MLSNFDLDLMIENENEMAADALKAAAYYRDAAEKCDNRTWAESHHKSADDYVSAAKAHLNEAAYWSKQRSIAYGDISA